MRFASLSKRIPHQNGLSLCLSKSYALIWVYLRHINLNNYNVIFDLRRQHRVLIFCLILELRGNNKFYSNRVKLLFKKFCKNGSLQLDPISMLLRKYPLKYDRDLLGIPEKITNYIELARSLSESSKKYSFRNNMEI